MFTTPQVQVPADFEMDSWAIVDAYRTEYGRATVERWDTEEGRVFYVVDEFTGLLVGKTTQVKARAILRARRHTRWNARTHGRA